MPKFLMTQAADGGYAEPAVPGGTGEQISQRLAQLQSQYDDELSGNVQTAVETQRRTICSSTSADPAPVFQAPVQEMSAYEPAMSADPLMSAEPVMPAEPAQHQFAQPAAPSTGHYAPEPPMGHEQPVSHEYEPAAIASASMAAEAGTFSLCL